MRRRPEWTDQQVTKLQNLWGKSLTAAQIASEMGDSFTRNAILGKANRLGMSLRRSTLRAESAPRSHKAKRVIAAESPAMAGRKAREINERLKAEAACKQGFDPAAALPESRLLTLAQMRMYGQCKWIYGDPANPEYRYCAADTPEGKSYCTTHHALVYVPLKLVAA